MYKEINSITSFLSRRDVPCLSSEELFTKYRIKQADMIMLLGNSNTYTAELAAQALKDGLGKHLMISGGIGHSTKYLIENIQKDERFKNLFVTGKSEAEILEQVILYHDKSLKNQLILEIESTNCGSNARESLLVLKEKDLAPESVILIQDPTLQQRTHASFLKEWENEKTLFISYAPYIPLLNENLKFQNNKMNEQFSYERFLDLILGEIPRLKDDKNGYGPNGKNFIVHVQIPEEVLSAFERLVSLHSEYKEIKGRK
ncbi:MAG: ElyC/SanA/YdcF family protein [Cytophagaceae bacterium]